MSVHVHRPAYDRIAVLEDALMHVNEDRIRLHAIVAQSRNLRRIERQYAATHNHFDLVEMRRAQEALDDLLDPLTAVWPDAEPSSILTNKGDA